MDKSWHWPLCSVLGVFFKSLYYCEFWILYMIALIFISNLWAAKGFLLGWSEIITTSDMNYRILPQVIWTAEFYFIRKSNFSFYSCITINFHFCLIHRFFLEILIVRFGLIWPTHCYLLFLKFVLRICSVHENQIICPCYNSIEIRCMIFPKIGHNDRLILAYWKENDNTLSTKTLICLLRKLYWG